MVMKEYIVVNDRDFSQFLKKCNILDKSFKPCGGIAIEVTDLGVFYYQAFYKPL